MALNAGYIYREGATPNTNVAVSQKVKIYTVSYGEATASQIGVSSEFTQEAESREMVAVRGIGYGDRVQEIVPGNTAEATISITRRLLYVLNLHQQLGYRGGVAGAVRSIRYHRWPFDLKQEMVFSELAHRNVMDNGGGDGMTTRAADADFDARVNGVTSAVVTWYEGCWVESYGQTGIAADGNAIDEQVSAKVTDVVSHHGFQGVDTFYAMNTGNNPFRDVGGGSALYGAAHPASAPRPDR